MAYITVQLDPDDVRRLKEKLGPDTFQRAISDALTDVTHYAEGEVKSRTPVVTGNLQRSIISDVTNASRWPDPETRLSTDQPYGWWIETGVRESNGAKMKTKPGGYRMFEEGAAATEQKLGALVDRAIKMIEAEWAK